MGNWYGKSKSSSTTTVAVEDADLFELLLAEEKYREFVIYPAELKEILNKWCQKYKVRLEQSRKH